MDPVPTPPARVRFAGGLSGRWQVMAQSAVAGPGLPPAARVDDAGAIPGAAWTLQGVASNQRYATRAEDTELRAVQEGLGRPAARHAALIPIRKSAAWWGLPQDERRALFAQAHHAIGMATLPQVARRLLHGRDLGEPFDFLTWFEFAPEHAPLFDAMLVQLRATEEWSFVEREVELRLVLDPGWTP